MYDAIFPVCISDVRAWAGQQRVHLPRGKPRGHCGRYPPHLRLCLPLRGRGARQHGQYTYCTPRPELKGQCLNIFDLPVLLFRGPTE